jgi:hypothetical protein
MMPPPNVTGRLHMGHALQDAIQDALTRLRRMQGYEALWVPGIDHAGIATQNVVERELKEQTGQTRHDLGREPFIDKVWEWKEEYGDIILQQKRRLGDSCDWSRERFTMDEGCSRAVQLVFIKLYEQGLVYRGDYLVNWDPENGTAISDEEVDNVERDGHLWYIKYPLADGSREVVQIATTRPETMLADTAVAVHPEDERYAAPHRPERHPPADEPGDPDHRRRLRQDGLRRRRAEGHPGPRQERLRDRQAARTRDHLGDRAGRHDQREWGRLRGPRPVRGAPAGGRRPRGAGAAGEGSRTSRTPSPSPPARRPSSSPSSRASGSYGWPRWRNPP